jgi:hypothetical protein
VGDGAGFEVESFDYLASIRRTRVQRVPVPGRDRLREGPASLLEALRFLRGWILALRVRSDTRRAVAVNALAGFRRDGVGLHARPRRRCATSSFDGSDGANCRYFNVGARIAWLHQQGDWLDANGVPQGDAAIARTRAGRVQPGQPMRLDVTRLVRGWQDGTIPNRGVLLSLEPEEESRAGIVFASREVSDARARPRLSITFDDGRPPVAIAPIADVSLDCTTAYTLGMRGTLTLNRRASIAMLFALPDAGSARVASAEIELVPASSGAPVALRAFRLDPPAPRTNDNAHAGFAAAYSRDDGIARHPGVLFATGFESPAWRFEWSYVGLASHVERIADDAPARRFVPLAGHALQVTIPQGGNLGLDMSFDFISKLGYEPESLYFRYYLRFADDWDPHVDGGKLPGLSGTYGRAGWGGRRADPTAGWSMRGLFHKSASRANPLHNLTPIGTYAYHADAEDDFGDDWDWMDNDPAFWAQPLAASSGCAAQYAR